MTLQVSLTSEEKDMLSAVHDYFKRTEDWIGSRTLQVRFGKAAVEQLEARNNPLLVTRYTESGKEVFKLTLAGFLLDDSDREDIDLLCRYLDFVKKRLRENPELEVLTSVEVEKALGIDSKVSRHLNQVIYHTNCWAGGLLPTHGGAWEARPPSDVIDLIESNNSREYLENRVAKTIRSNPARETVYDPLPYASLGMPNDSYVSVSRIEELRQLSTERFDLSRLVRLCEELNAACNAKSYMTIAMIVRAIIDHVPPLFDVQSFNQIANNYCGSKSFKESMTHLNKSLRNVADGHLHVRIRAKEVLPEFQQVDFRSDVDLLLGEIIRVLKP